MKVAGSAWLIDQALTFLAWDHLIGLEADDIAVGGFGRSELHPHSDIDILILLHSESGKRHQRAIEQFLTLLWDCHLEVGFRFAPLPNAPSNVLILLSSPL